MTPSAPRAASMQRAHQSCTSRARAGARADAASRVASSPAQRGGVRAARRTPRWCTRCLPPATRPAANRRRTPHGRRDAPRRRPGAHQLRSAWHSRSAGRRDRAEPGGSQISSPCTIPVGSSTSTSLRIDRTGPPVRRLAGTLAASTRRRSPISMRASNHTRRELCTPAHEHPAERGSSTMRGHNPRTRNLATRFERAGALEVRRLVCRDTPEPSRSRCLDTGRWSRRRDRHLELTKAGRYLARSDLGRTRERCAAPARGQPRFERRGGAVDLTRESGDRFVLRSQTHAAAIDGRPSASSICVQMRPPTRSRAPADDRACRVATSRRAVVRPRTRRLPRTHPVSTIGHGADRFRRRPQPRPALTARGRRTFRRRTNTAAGHTNTTARWGARRSAIRRSGRRSGDGGSDREWNTGARRGGRRAIQEPEPASGPSVITSRLGGALREVGHSRDAMRQCSHRRRERFAS